MPSKLTKIVVLFLPIVWAAGGVFAQFLVDGPVRVITRVKQVHVNYSTLSDSSLNYGPFTPPASQTDEYKFKFWVRDRADIDGLDWIGGNCTGFNMHPPGTSAIMNDTIADLTFGPMVPDKLGLKMEAWEDDIPSDFSSYPGLSPCHGGSVCTRDTNFCCYFFGSCSIPEEDDRHCREDSLPVLLNYRSVPPCGWYNHGSISSSCDSTGGYAPVIETWWQYVDGDGFANNIDLGVFNVDPITHFNSNSCYTNQYLFGGGKDVIYSFRINQPKGITITLCGGTSFDSRVFLLDSSKAALASNNDYCGLASQVSVPLCDPGIYYFVVDGRTAGDEGSFLMTISQDPDQIPRANAGPDREICQGETVFLGGSPTASVGTTLEWSPVEGLDFYNVPNPLATPDSTTDYVVTVSSPSGCVVKDTARITVFIPHKPALTYLEPVLFSSDADHWQWYMDSGLIPGATDSFIIAIDTGFYYVIVTDSNGCITSSDTLLIIPVQRNKPIVEIPLKIFPNPSANLFTLEWSGRLKETGFLRVHSLGGQLVYSTELEVGQERNQIPAESWPESIYFMEMKSGNRISRKKLIRLDQ